MLPSASTVIPSGCAVPGGSVAKRVASSRFQAWAENDNDETRTSATKVAVRVMASSGKVAQDSASTARRLDAARRFAQGKRPATATPPGETPTATFVPSGASGFENNTARPATVEISAAPPIATPSTVRPADACDPAVRSLPDRELRRLSPSAV